MSDDDRFDGWSSDYAPENHDDAYKEADVSRQGDLDAPIICRWCGEELTLDDDGVWTDNNREDEPDLCAGDNRGTNHYEPHVPTYRGVVVGYNERAVEALRNPPEVEPWD